MYAMLTVTAHSSEASQSLPPEALEQMGTCERRMVILERIDDDGSHDYNLELFPGVERAV